MKGVLNDIISDTQSAFIQGRLIIDNILIGHEYINAIKNHRHINKDMAALKIDLNKAYDRVERPYLKEIMIKLGFDVSWVNLIMNCISTASFSVLANGK